MRPDSPRPRPDGPPGSPADRRPNRALAAAAFVAVVAGIVLGLWFLVGPGSGGRGARTGPKPSPRAMVGIVELKPYELEPLIGKPLDEVEAGLLERGFTSVAPHSFVKTKRVDGAAYVVDESIDLTPDASGVLVDALVYFRETDAPIDEPSVYVELPTFEERYGQP